VNVRFCLTEAVISWAGDGPDTDGLRLLTRRAHRLAARRPPPGSMPLLARCSQVPAIISSIYPTVASRTGAARIATYRSGGSGEAIACCMWVPKTCATWPDAPLTAGCSAPRLAGRGMIFGLWP
jgi:hypothetical protein